MIMVMTKFYLILACLFVRVIGGTRKRSSKYIDDYPTEIPYYPVRVDATNQTVTSNRMNLIGGVPTDFHHIREHSKVQVTLKEFTELLQCAPNEPILDSETGTLSLLKMIKPTKEILELMCIWAETGCQPWIECQKRLKEFQAGRFPDKFEMNHFHFFEMFRLLRVKNGKLYADWPWGFTRIGEGIPNYWQDMTIHQFNLIEMMLSKIKDFPDVTFFFGNERPVMPWNFPFPGFTFAPSLGFNSLAWPWKESHEKALELYKSLNPSHVQGESHSTSVGAKYEEATRQLPWPQRKHKAAFFATWDDHRQVFYDQARLHPELLEARFNILPFHSIRPTNPASNESVLTINTLKTTSKTQLNEARDLPPGYSLPLLTIAEEMHYVPGHYKYIVTLLGLEARSTSGRLAQLLAHSGAVVLLAKSPFFYHFSARLQPWVHYVPISYSGADIVEKVEWLQSHDVLAQRIAENARNFGQSFLRLEDYYCYAATSLATLAEVMEGSDVLEPFSNATMISQLP